MTKNNENDMVQVRRDHVEAALLILESDYFDRDKPTDMVLIQPIRNFFKQALASPVQVIEPTCYVMGDKS